MIKMAQIDYVKIPDVLTVDPLLAVSNQKSVVIRKGASSNTTQLTTASSIGPSLISFQPSLNNSRMSILDPYMFVELAMTVTLSATGLNQPIKTYVQNLFALRQYPLNSVINTCSVQLNGQTLTSQPWLIAHQLTQFQDFIDNESIWQSLTPIMPDMAPQYSDLVGSIASPLNSYNVGTTNLGGQPRGAFNSAFVDVVSGTGTWTFTTTIREPLLVPGLSYTPSGAREGMPYINNLQVQLNFLGYLSRMFSLDAASCPAITDIAVTFNNAILHNTFLTSPLNQSLPSLAVRSFNAITANQTSNGGTTVAAGVQTTLQSQSYNLPMIPSKIWVYVIDSQTDTATGYSKSDVTFSIQQLTLTFNDKVGFMSNQGVGDLYNNLVASEGNHNSFIQTQYKVGSVLCIDPVRLLGLDDNQTSGTPGPFLLNLQVTCTNITNRTILPSLVVTWGIDTVMTTTPQFETNLSQGYITGEQVLQAASLAAVPGSFLSENIYGGGAAWDKIKNFFRNSKIISKTLPILGALAPEFSPITGALGSLAQQQGLGRTSKQRLANRAYGQSLRY